MSNFRLQLTEHASFVGTYQWTVVARREYSLTTDMWKPKFADSMLYDARVERTGRDPNVRASAKVDANQLFAFVQVAYHQLRVPLIGVHFPSGLDGTTYTVEHSTIGFGSIKISWWSSYPEEWEPLTEWFERITTFLNEAIDNKDA